MNQPVSFVSTNCFVVAYSDLLWTLLFIDEKKKQINHFDLVMFLPQTA